MMIEIIWTYDEGKYKGGEAEAQLGQKTKAKDNEVLAC